MASEILLHEVTADDLPIFIAQQLDPEANYMAAFNAKDPTDQAAYIAQWTGFANALREEAEEYLLRLAASQAEV